MWWLRPQREKMRSQNILTSGEGFILLRTSSIVLWMEIMDQRRDGRGSVHDGPTDPFSHVSQILFPFGSCLA